MCFVKTVVALFFCTDASCNQGDVNWDKENVLVEDKWQRILFQDLLERVEALTTIRSL